MGGEGDGVTLVGNGVVVGCVGVGWDVKKRIAACQTGTVYHSSSKTHYYLVKLEKS